MVLRQYLGRHRVAASMHTYLQYCCKFLTLNTLNSLMCVSISCYRLLINAFLQGQCSPVQSVYALVWWCIEIQLQWAEITGLQWTACWNYSTIVMYSCQNLGQYWSTLNVGITALYCLMLKLGWPCSDWLRLKSKIIVYVTIRTVKAKPNIDCV